MDLQDPGRPYHHGRGATRLRSMHTGSKDKGRGAEEASCPSNPQHITPIIIAYISHAQMGAHTRVQSS